MPSIVLSWKSWRRQFSEIIMFSMKRQIMWISMRWFCPKSSLQCTDMHIMLTKEKYVIFKSGEMISPRSIYVQMIKQCQWKWAKPEVWQAETNKRRTWQTIHVYGPVSYLYMHDWVIIYQWRKEIALV